LDFEFGEEVDSEDGVDYLHKEEQGAHLDQVWQGYFKSSENLTELLHSSHHLHRPQNPERPDQCSALPRRHIKHLKNKAEYREHHNEEVELAPAVFEVKPALNGDQNDCFDDIDQGEGILDAIHDRAEP